MALVVFLDLLLVVTGFLESVWAAGLAEAVEVDPPVEPRLYASKIRASIFGT